MKKTALCIFTICIFSLMLTKAVAIKRSDVITEAQRYAKYTWTVKRTNPIYAIYDSCGRVVIGEAYSFGDKESPENFWLDIADSLIPRNWKTNFNDSTQRIYTGIDCSGLVTRCWFFDIVRIDTTSASDLFSYTIPVVGTTKSGDLWWDSAHVFLQSEATDTVYEANPKDIPELGQRVQRKSNTYPNYKKRSIFPQFSALKPLPDSAVKIENKPFVIELTASGSISIENVKMWLDGDSVSPSVHGKKTSKTIKYKPESITPGKHYVKVQCSNVVNGIAYEDTVSWYFRYGKPGWYDCNDNITGKKAYWLVMDNSDAYELYRNTMPIPWTWSATLKGVDTLTDLHLTGIYDMPRWATTDNDTFILSDNQPVIEPVFNGCYNISVDGAVIASVDGVHEYVPTIFGTYWNRVFCPPTDLHNLKITNPGTVAISYTPPVWPSIFDNTIVYLNSEAVLIGAPQLNAYAAGSVRILWGEDVKPLPNVTCNEYETMLYEGLTNKRTTECFLEQNCPNPFIRSTNIQYSLKTESVVSLKIYNLQGQLVKTLVNCSNTAGIHSIVWDGKNDNGTKVCQGVYLYRITAGDYSATKKLLLLK